MALFDVTLNGNLPDDIAHIIQMSLAPAFMPRALDKMYNVSSTCFARIADEVNATADELDKADTAGAHHLSRRISFLRRR